MHPSSAASFSSSSSSSGPFLTSAAFERSAEAEALPASASVAASASSYPYYQSMSSPINNLLQPQLYRSSAIDFHSQPLHHVDAFNPLDAPTFRAVTLDAPPHPHPFPTQVEDAPQSWVNMNEVAQQTTFEGWGAVHKQSTEWSMPSKAVTLPTFDLLASTAATSTSITLPSMPLFLENTAFSCSLDALAPSTAMDRVRKVLSEMDVTCEERKDRDMQLCCCSSSSIRPCSFRVSCYGGSITDCSEGSARYFTIEFQRRSGCGMAFMQLFKKCMRSVSNNGEVKLESRISMGEELKPLPIVDVEGLDASELSMLPIPSLCADAAALIPDEALTSSLLDLLTGAPEQQVESLAILASVLDSTAAGQETASLLRAAASKLQDGTSCDEVRAAAARAINCAVASPCSQKRALATQECTQPLVSAVVQALTCSPNASSPSASTAEDSSVAAMATLKPLLRCILNLSQCSPSFLERAWRDAGLSSPLASARLRRELMRISAASERDQEMSNLASTTMQLIQGSA